jgi:hypothetical protein
MTERTRGLHPNSILVSRAMNAANPHREGSEPWFATLRSHYAGMVREEDRDWSFHELMTTWTPQPARPAEQVKGSDE